jgi:hypothetical protein
MLVRSPHTPCAEKPQAEKPHAECAVYDEFNE